MFFISKLKSSNTKPPKILYILGEDGKAVKVNCYFINYKIFVNIVKYKLDMMRKKMEVTKYFAVYLLIHLDHKQMHS